MIIKKHKPASWFHTLFNLGQYAFVVGTVALLLTIVGLIIFQTRFTVSPSGHFFDEPVEVAISVSNPFQKNSIRYTLDGSLPTADSTTYQSPFTLDETTMIQLATFDAKGNQTSKVYTHPIFIGAQHDLPVISIVTEEHNLFDPEYGIYANYTLEGDEWERPAHLTFFEPDGTLGFKKDVGIRIHGGGSATYPQKSFRIYAGYMNHADQIKYPIFPELSYDTFNTFILRAAGGDWQYAYMRDSIMHELAQDSTNLDVQAVRPAVLYLNNKYWGLYYLRERIDQHYIANKYGLSKDKLSVMEIRHDNGPNRGLVERDFGGTKGVDEYNRLFNLVLEDCLGCVGYERVAPYLDIDNFIEYFFMQVYSGNFDWPFGNVKLWRYEQPTIATPEEKSPIDGRLRWIFYDLDVSFAFTKQTEEEVIKSAQNNAFNRLDDERFPFRNLIYGRSFREDFLERATVLLNTTVTEEYINKIIDKRVASVEAEMPREIARWKDEMTREDVRIFQSMDEWRHNVNLLKVYTKYRTPDLFEDIVTFYSLEGTTNIQIATSPPQAGTVSISGIHKSQDQYPWKGTFFKNTKTVIQAHPNNDYVFDHWEGDIPTGNKYNDTVSALIKNQRNITAVFREKKWYEYIYYKD